MRAETKELEGNSEIIKVPKHSVISGTVLILGSAGK